MICGVLFSVTSPATVLLVCKYVVAECFEIKFTLLESCTLMTLADHFAFKISAFSER